MPWDLVSSKLHTKTINKKIERNCRQKLFHRMYTCTNYSKLKFPKKLWSAVKFWSWVTSIQMHYPDSCSLSYYALLSSSVDWMMSLATLISMVSGFKASLPFSSFSGSFLSEEKRNHGNT